MVITVEICRSCISRNGKIIGESKASMVCQYSTRETLPCLEFKRKKYRFVLIHSKSHLHNPRTNSSRANAIQTTKQNINKQRKTILG